MLNAGTVGLAIALAAAQAPGRIAWTTVAPDGAGFSIQAPGTPVPKPNKPNQYGVTLEEAAFIVDADPLDADIQQALAAGDRQLVTKAMEAFRDVTITEMKGTRRTTSSADFDGHPSLFFTFDGAVGDQKYEAAQRIVVANDRLYLVVVVGTAGKVPKADIDRFHKSFRILKVPPAARTAAAPAAPPADGYVAMSYAAALCDKLPPIGVHFEIPADFIARSPTRSVESGCLLGTPEDLDRVTKDPSQGDFSELTRGVFHLRVSTEVINDPQTGIFDGMDGTGEEGLRRQLVGFGAKLITFKKETIAGLPALQIVADLGPDRAYMLYLGNTRFNSNAIFINFHRPAKKSPDDDRTWARFIAGIKPN